MAVFGFQLCFTLIVASLLQKIMPIYSFGRWLLCNGSLMRFCHPSNEELWKVSGKKAEPLKGRKRKNGFVKNTQEEMKTFKVSKNIDIVLDRETIDVKDCLILKNYNEYQWLVDYSLSGLLVYAGTDLYYDCWKPRQEFNISTVWMLLSVWFAFRNLLSIVWLYTKLKVGGEISMSIAFALFSFILSLAFLIVKKDIFEFDLGDLPDTSLFSASRLQLLLAFFSAVLGGLFIFPAIRMTQMYVCALTYAEGNFLLQALLHFNFFAPVLVSVTWINSVVEFLSQNPRTGKTMLTHSQVDILRIYLIIVACAMRVGLFRVHLQAYLNIAHDKFVKLRKETGMILNTDLQRLISQVYYYLGVVATQYLSPAIVLLCLTLCYKSVAGFSWWAASSTYSYPLEKSANASTSALPFADDSMRELMVIVERSMCKLRSEFPVGLGKEVFSYMVWWCATNWFVASCVGYFYHIYLSE